MSFAVFPFVDEAHGTPEQREWDELNAKFAALHAARVELKKTPFFQDPDVAVFVALVLGGAVFFGAAAGGMYYSQGLGFGLVVVCAFLVVIALYLGMASAATRRANLQRAALAELDQTLRETRARIEELRRPTAC